MKLSIIIPARKEKYLNRTIRDLQNKAEGEIEIIVVLDGADEERIDGVRYIYNPEAIGMKYAINKGVAMATGEYLMKIDAHCLVAPGFDEQLKRDHQPNWIQIPRRYRLNEDEWKPDHSKIVEYEYWIWPFKYQYPSLHGFRWDQRSEERKNYLLDDTLTFQGSFWFMTKEWWDKNDFMHDEGYNELHAQEAVYIGNTTWKNSGRVMVNKKTWYCHGHLKRSFGIHNERRDQCYKYSYQHWVHDNRDMFEKLIEKFWPIPNWPEDWKEQLWKN